MKVAFHLHAVAATLALLAGGLASPTAHALSDEKSISPTSCTPRGPGTTLNELTYGPYGITNPGTTNETILCPINGDSDSTWSSSEGGSAYAYVHYRIGAVAGAIACTVFSGTAVTTSSPTYSGSFSSLTQPAYGRGSLYVAFADSAGAYGAAAPSVLICTIPPKAAIGWIYFTEFQATDTP